MSMHRAGVVVEHGVAATPQSRGESGPASLECERHTFAHVMMATGIACLSILILLQMLELLKNEV